MLQTEIVKYLSYHYDHVIFVMISYVAYHSACHDAKDIESDKDKMFEFPALFPVTPPAQRVQFILGEDHDEAGHEPHPLFSEMEELFLDDNGEMEWKETAR